MAVNKSKQLTANKTRIWRFIDVSQHVNHSSTWDTSERVVWDLTWWRNIYYGSLWLRIGFHLRGKIQTESQAVLSGYLFGFAIKLLPLKALFYKQMGFSTITNGIKLKSHFGYLTMNPSVRPFHWNRTCTDIFAKLRLLIVYIIRT